MKEIFSSVRLYFAYNGWSISSIDLSQSIEEVSVKFSNGTNLSSYLSFHSTTLNMTIQVIFNYFLSLNLLKNVALLIFNIKDAWSADIFPCK